MKNKILWITQTAAMLALLIALQWATSYIPKPAGQFVTGSLVNAVLGVTVLAAGISSGATVAVLSPIFAFLLNIAPNLVTVPAIMVGNVLFVVTLKLAGGNAESMWRRVSALLAAALIKFAALYTLVVWVICGVAAEALLAQGLLKKPMLNVLPATFSAPQLVTALIGGAVALVIAPRIRRALHK